ncbi:esterase/lipase family protein [Streptomyces violaceusniger]|uniref:Alpha/beta hydrolase fold containing protein n=2 Tax=Streptomyces violaceusniger group TaxID=2839105 RepID=G2NVU5_STRV4|nr:alpha/beta fold hydrolase [Streptomyces violaceusniger]AEM86186.1 alpha/beta hydrolase fold containing protein [Streptomyces violaceusniger Tu 4113]
MLPRRRIRRFRKTTKTKPRTLLPALALAVAATAATPTAALATDTASQGVSSGWNDYSCKPSAQHPRPVVLVHGTLGNSVDNWLGFAPYLVKRGYCVFSLDYGQLPAVPFFHGLGAVDQSAKQLSTHVDRVLAATGAAKVDMVGHSQGGMMPRYYLKFLGGAPKVNALVGVAPTNHGTTLSGLTKLLDYFPGAGDLIAKGAPGLMDQVVGSDFLRRLNEGGDTVPGVRYTVIATKYDEVATPYQAQFLSGPNVKNVVIQDLCATDISEHLAIGLTDGLAFHEAVNALDPDHATPTTCASDD